MIQLAGHDVQVTSNLFDALHRLRSDDGVTQNIWVDALCINQKDLEERSWQVQMMGRVYAAASRVIVWLGEPSLNFYAAEVGRLLEVFDEEKNSVIDDCTTGFQDLEDFSHEELRNTVPKHKGVRVFFENVWFSRIWVLQEVFNARKILVRCGDRAFSWSLVLKINENVRRTLSEPAPQYHKAMPPLFSGLFALTKPTQVPYYDTCSTISTRFGYTARAPTENILDLVVAGFSLEATDPRDKLFALLGFIDPKYHHLDVLRPNYEKDVAIIYRDFTRWWIASHRSLRILSAIHCSKGRTWQRLSAYSPSFRDSKRTSWSLWYDGMSAWGRATLGLSPSVEGPGASGNMELDTSLLLKSNDSSLLLKGIMLGIIHDIKPFPYGIAAFHDQDPSAPSTSYRDHYERVFDPLNQRAVFSSSSQGGLEVPFESRIPPADLVYDHISTHESYARQNGGALECHPRCFFTTVDEKSGLCPNAAKEGDCVVVLFGGTIPYVLRFAHDIESSNGLEDTFSEISTSNIRRRRAKFVGECFVDGYMNGESIQEKQDQIVEFELV
ncbi:hypothetical protein BOTNAR_2699g00010 [Botryotinia narcissicola]|uniref:Heterokaryon incompatibility domain-containing protein n=1 Tax=Botryotinia narcissicola TaxID=278944 RepID=A0A4Z1H4X5_9HELO|nr:hypothetical protein BOTNAR_2699g00010 [Botryotinia narcissicola]